MAPGHERPCRGRALSGRSLVLLSLLAASIACLFVMTADDSSAEPPDLEGDLGSVSWAYYESNQTIIFSGTGSFEPPSHSWDADSYSELPFETAVIQSGITGIGLIAGIIVAAVAIIAAGAYVFVRMKKKC